MSHTELIQVFGTTTDKQATNSLVFPDSKLQTLDRRVGKDQLIFDSTLFAETVNLWENIPVIYHPEGIHPSDFPAVESNPELASMQIGGKLVGRVHNPRIVIEGGARLMATLVIDEEEDEIRNLWQTGKLFPSTAFSTRSDGDKIVTPPIPNHVLLFPMEVDKVLPGDFGAFVNTLEVVKPMTETAQNDVAVQVDEVNAKTKLSFYEWIEQTVNKIIAKNNQKNTETEQPITDTVTEEVPAVADTDTVVEEQSEVVAETVEETETVADVPGAEIDSTETIEETESVQVVAPAESVDETQTVTDVEETNSELVNELNSIKAELEQYKLREKEQMFDKLLQSLPVGMKRNEEEIAGIKNMFETNPAELVFTVLEHVNNSHCTEVAGEKYTFTESTQCKYTTVGDLTKI